MPVFDFKESPVDKKDAVCTYKTFKSTNSLPSADCPLMTLDNKNATWNHHSTGVFTNPIKRTSFEFEREDGVVSSDIITIDSRFTNLLKWLGENHIKVRLSGKNTENGYAVYKIREQAYGGGTKLSSEDGFLQFMIDRLLNSNPPSEDVVNEDEIEETGDDMKITSIQTITDFIACAGRTLPDNIQLWARRNLAVARSHEVSQEERRHAQRALSIMLNIQWKSNFFESIDPERARKILDEELYGMEKVKQRIIETIIQINRTHTLPAYGLLLAGPAGTGKSQVAYAVAKILKLPWANLDMSSINDPEQLTGSSRVYSNAKPGIIMDAFSVSRQSNLVFITNDKENISAPLMSRFAVIDIPDYTPEEKQIIFKKFVLPKILKRMRLNEDECVVTDEGVEAVVELYKGTTGIRDLEQAAEHIAANALYNIEVTKVSKVVFDKNMVIDLLG